MTYKHTWKNIWKKSMVPYKKWREERKDKEGRTEKMRRKIYVQNIYKNSRILRCSYEHDFLINCHILWEIMEENYLLCTFIMQKNFYNTWYEKMVRILLTSSETMCLCSQLGGGQILRIYNQPGEKSCEFF